MTTRPRVQLLLPLALAAVLSLTACGGSSGGDAQVASIATTGSSGTTATKAASGDLEKKLNDYMECLRKQGVDVPDATVDADGNVSFGRPSGGNPQDIDRGALEDAQKACGDLPEGLTNSMQESVNSPEFQDAALKFAKCMRAEGVDMKDPDFSQIGSGGGNPFGEIDRDDPKVSAALEVCQKEFAAVLPNGSN